MINVPVSYQYTRGTEVHPVFAQTVNLYIYGISRSDESGIYNLEARRRAVRRAAASVSRYATLTTLRNSQSASFAAAMIAARAASAPFRRISVRDSGEYQALCGVQNRLGACARAPECAPFPRWYGSHLRKRQEDHVRIM